MNIRKDFFDDQDKSVDIYKLYSDFVSEIDSIRSYIGLNINTTNMDEVFNDGLSIKVETEPKESRCHAFFRMIGFPVYSSSGIYNSGFYVPNNGNTKDKERKLNIAKNISKEMFALMYFRERYLDNFYSKFSQSNLESSILALTSVNIRTFISPLENNNGIYDVTKPSYTLSLKDSVGKNFSDYISETGEKAQSIQNKRDHYIKPFMVDPRIENYVAPSQKMIAVPFAEDQSKISLGGKDTVRRPYIEYVCRNRLDDRNKLDNLTDSQSQIIANSQLFNNQESFQRFSEGISKYTVSQKTQYLKYYNIMRALISELKKAEHAITTTRSEYFWVPVPSKKGPEFGTSTRNIIVGDSLNEDNDIKISEMDAAKKFNEIMKETLDKTEKDIGGFAFQSKSATPDENRGVNDILSQSLDQEMEKRRQQCNKANDAIKKIEIIMGEFSGLGLCDIIAIYAALWLVDEKYLIDLLDDDSFNRMSKLPFLQAKVVKDRMSSGKSDPAAALQAFEDQVRLMYQTMDAIYNGYSLQNTE